MVAYNLSPFGLQYGTGVSVLMLGLSEPCCPAAKQLSDITTAGGHRRFSLFYRSEPRNDAGTLQIGNFYYICFLTRQCAANARAGTATEPRAASVVRYYLIGAISTRVDTTRPRTEVFETKHSFTDLL